MVAVGSELGVVRLVWAEADGAREPMVVWRGRVHHRSIEAVALSRDGRFLVAAGAPGRVFIARTGLGEGGRGIISVEVDGYIDIGAEVTALAFLTDGSLVGLQKGAGVFRLQPAAAASAAAAVTPQPPPGLFGALPGTAVKLQSFRAPCELNDIVEGPQAGTVFCLGVDKSLKFFSLPSTAQGWTGLGGRVRQPDAEVALGDKQGSVLALSADGGLILAGATDGSAALFSASGVASGIAPALWKWRPHASTVGGVKTVAFAAGGLVLSAGVGGSVVAVMSEPAAKIMTVSRQDFAVETSEGMDLDELDDAEEPTQCADTDVGTSVNGADGQSVTLSPRAHAATSEASSETRNSLRKRVEGLRDTFVMCLENNERAPEIEKLSRTEFLVDVELRDKLASDGDALVEKTRTNIAESDLANEVITSRLIETCWNTSIVKSVKTLALGSSGVAVENFPLPNMGRTNDLAKKAMMLRKVENLEVESRGLGQTLMGQMGVDMTGAALMNDLTPRLQADGVGGSPTLAAAGGARGAESPSFIKESEEEEIDAKPIAESLLYGTFELTTSLRKRAQSLMLNALSREHRERFNTRFEMAQKDKLADIDKIADIASRIQEIADELKVVEPVDMPTLSPLEIANETLTVKDSEVGVEKHVTKEELERLAKEEAEERRFVDVDTRRGVVVCIGEDLATDVGGDGGHLGLYPDQDLVGQRHRRRHGCRSRRRGCYHLPTITIFRLARSLPPIVA